MNKEPLIIIAGPTGAGKTDISIKLAKEINGSIISADSMQVYKGMDIGSAKITKDEMQGVDHYLIDILDPKTDEFNVVYFQQLAREAMKDIRSKGKNPIVVGGTGFYIQALLYDIDFTETGNNEASRSEYHKFAEEHGLAALHDLLKEKDPAAAEQIHMNNLKRVIRALEFYDETGTRISEHNEEQHKKTSPYDYAFFVLTDHREKLYSRINSRVDKMMEAGLENEVRGLYGSGLRDYHISMKGIGYREFFPYFNGEYDLVSTVEKIKQDTRHFAKRQLTWFQRESDTTFINKTEFDYDDERIVKYMIKIAGEKNAYR